MERPLIPLLRRLIDHWIDGSPAAVSQISELCQQIALATSSGHSTIGEAERQLLSHAYRLAGHACQRLSLSMECRAAPEYSRHPCSVAPIRVRIWEG
jgi:hypothetical protein